MWPVLGESSNITCNTACNISGEESTLVTSNQGAPIITSNNQPEPPHISPSELRRAFLLVDERMQKGRKKQDGNGITSNTISEPQDKSHIKTAEVLGISPSQVQRLRSIEDYGNEVTRNLISRDKTAQVLGVSPSQYRNITSNNTVEPSHI
jgi:plasmid maintenance system antidote protein VapI